jgi:hypothetical protein
MVTRLTLPGIQRAVWQLLAENGRLPTIPTIASSVGLSYRQFQRALAKVGKTGRQVRAWCA